MIERVRAQYAGYTNQLSALSFPQMEKTAPMMGPTMNPMEKAIPTRAIPFPRVLGVESSVTIAVARLTLPLESPPTILWVVVLQKILSGLARIPGGNQNRYVTI